MHTTALFPLCFPWSFHPLVTGTTRLSDDTLELVDLLLGTNEGSEPLLGELAGTLVLGVAEKFDDTALVGGKASNLLDNLTDESRALAQVTLATGHARLVDAEGRLVATVLANSQTGLGGRFLSHCYDIVEMILRRWLKLLG
jgi:hypothetical protein